MSIQHKFNSLKTMYINNEPKNLVKKICTCIEEHGIKLYAVVDHQNDMEALRVYSYPAFTILFGNPRMGSKLLEKLPMAAIDIPLRISVIQSQSGKGSTVIFRDMDYLFKEYIKQVKELRYWAQEVNAILTRLVEQCR
ncbi:DUF302 domain-containing protein [Bacillus benzoevorans]|uniref:Uncharacterized protein (DUF302 family) n=1 Tax=Bacillus benzoevorans TaxID=1456 RepID=A0A7X0LVR2_9BACI|nr:DUF302 domain-containing protein [Bacillus benzoevorans]MBB6446291.1 uncharacterized protein (DUF302 family) [Bacillus benzoevorans]